MNKLPSSEDVNSRETTGTFAPGSAAPAANPMTRSFKRISPRMAIDLVPLNTRAVNRDARHDIIVTVRRRSREAR